MKDSNLIIVLDIETTGLDPYYHMICEIGLCFLDLDSGEIEEIFNIICREKNKKCHKYAWIFMHSSLKYDDVMKAGYLSDCKTEIQDIFDLGYLVTAYNQEFDFGFLENRGFRIENKFFDPMLKLTNIMKMYHHYYGYKYPSVVEAYDYFFPDNNLWDVPHRALNDAIIEARIIFETNKLLNNKKSK